jgi:hypothetical protein
MDKTEHPTFKIPVLGIIAVKVKCKECGKLIDGAEVAQRLSSKFIAVSVPVCWKCRRKNNVDY